MMYAQLRGNNQGIIKVTTKGIARDPTATPVVVEHETMLSACLNGNKNAGMVVLSQAMDVAAKKAAEHGFGICGTNNTSTSTGALGYYAENLAKRGLISLVFAVSPEFVAPNGAIEPVFGTNPIGVGIPTANGPVVLDMATSAYSFFGLLEARTAGKKIPHGVAIDGKGNITEDPNAAIDGGAIKTFDGGYKSSNLALIVELLAGPPRGRRRRGQDVREELGQSRHRHRPGAAGPGRVREARGGRDRTGQEREEGAGGERDPPPGERGDAFAEGAKSAGVIDVEKNLWAGLQELAGQYDAATSASVSTSAGAATKGQQA